MAKANKLEKELATYTENLSDLLSRAGKYVLIKGDHIEGTYDSYADALQAGYKEFGLEPFLVKQIAPTERILSFTRDYEFVCPQ